MTTYSFTCLTGRPVYFVSPNWWCYSDDHYDSWVFHNIADKQWGNDPVPPPQKHRTIRRRAKDKPSVRVMLMIDSITKGIG